MMADKDALASDTRTVVSKDGTVIAYERIGSGPPVVVVDGAFCSRTMGPGHSLAKPLAEHFTVYIYDRRGRGGSGDTLPYDTDRELEDLRAVIDAAGGTADVFGHSSGASLALEAARQGLPIRRLALYEAPMVVDDSRPPVGEDYGERLRALIEAGRPGAAIKQFMTEGVRVPKAMTLIMPLTPAWSKLKAVAPTVVYDTAFVEPYLKGHPLPAERWAAIDLPTLVLLGGKSPAWMKHGVQELAGRLPGARLQVLDGQTHMVKPGVVAPVLREFFADAA
ncbi:MAG TPA: alpha/beta hydrolase [Actinocrinis sp.]|jgi:pimeloyl-ACP methyl ester carboxylesterase